MASIADIHFTADLDDSRLQVDAKRAGDKAGTTMGKGITGSIKKSWSGAELGKGLVQGLGLAGGLGAANLLSAGLGKVVDFMGDSINASRDFTESLSKNKVVFGDAAKSVEDFGATTAKALGISKQAAIEAAGTFGALFVGLDIGQAESAKMSTTLVTLAGDLASFYNIADPKVALEKLRAGLAGEAEPLRAVGVFLTEAKVKAKAMELGLVDLNGEVSEAGKVQARYQLILEGSTIAQGDAAKTIGQLAGQQRVAAAELEESQVRLGKSFEPIALGVTQIQIAVVEGMGTLDQAVGDAQIALREFLTGIPESSRRAAAGLEPIPEAVEGMTGQITASGRAVRTSVAKTGDSFGDLADKADKETKKVVVSFDDMVSALSADVGRLIDDVRDPAIQAAELLTIKEEDAALRRIINAKDSTDEEIRDARRRRLSLAKEADETRLSLLESGNLSAKDADVWLGKLEREYANATGSAKADIGTLIAKINELRRITAKDISVVVKGYGLNIPGVDPRAAGGPVTAGRPYVVGEKRPELFVPTVNGYVLPSVPASASSVTSSVGAGGTTVNLTMPVERAPSAFETATQLRRLGDFGVLTGRTRPLVGGW